MAAKRVVSRQSVIPGLIALIYLIFLVVPWALTYKIAKDPEFLIRKTSTGYIHYYDTSYEPWYFRLDDSLMTAIHVLESIQIILCFPVLSALLARAAVIYSQRYKPDQKHHLTVRQLFALADQGWYNLLLVLQKPAISGLLIFGWLLLAVALTLPIVRSALVTYDTVTLSLDYQEYYVNSTSIGSSPAPGELRGVRGDSMLDNTRTKLQSTTGGYESQLWPTCHDDNTTRYWESNCGNTYLPYNSAQSSLSSYWEAATLPGNYSNTGLAPMFAASLQAGSTSGYAPYAYALGLQSGAKCVAAGPDDVASNCTRAAAESNGWNTSIFMEHQIRIDICVPSSGNNDPFWGSVNGSSPWKPYNFVEDMYIGIQEQRDTDGYMYDSWGQSGTQEDYDEDDELGTGTTLWAHCQLNTDLSYFLLGNDSSNGVPSPFLDELPSDFVAPSDVTDGDVYWSSPGLGPLMTTAQALFGSGSWFDLLSTVVNDNASTVADNTTGFVILNFLCQSMPLSQASYFTTSTALPSWCDSIANEDFNTMSANLLRAFFAIFDIPRLGRAALNTGAFFTNDYLLSSALPSGFYFETANTEYNSLYHFDSYITAPRIPVASTATFVVVTILIAIQALAILALVAVIYSVPVWTHTLDALALAGLGAQLAERVVFHSAGSWGADTLRPSEVDADARKELFGLDGLIDLTGGQQQTPSNSSTDRSVGGNGNGTNRGVEMENLPPPYAARNEESDNNREGAGRHVAERAGSTEEAPPYSSSREALQASGPGESRGLEEESSRAQ